MQLVKKGRRTYGGIYTLPNSVKVYLAHRKEREIWRAGKKTVSEAIQDGSAAWAIDDDTLITIRAQGIKFVGVLVKDSKDVYMTTIDRFFDPSICKVLNFEARGGALQRYLPLTEFQRRPGQVKIR